MKWAGERLLAGLAILAVVGITALFVAFRPSPVPGVRMEEAIAPDPGSAPLALRIWYPERQASGAKLPLVVLSHGTGGSSAGHADTAIALVRAGFIVAAMDHTGDNYRDTSHVGKGTHLSERPRHVSRTIDYMLDQWPRRATIDPARIAMFGHSAGGFTALVIAGAEPDLSRGAAFCRERPESWTCQYLRKSGLRTEELGRQRGIAWHHDPRVKAAAIAAPAIGYSFDRAALAGVRIPFQLWAAKHDAIVDDSADTIRQAMPVPPDYRRADGAGHFSFIEPCGLPMRAIITVMHWFGTEAICSDPAGFDRTHFHESFNRSLVEFYRKSLGGAAPMSKQP